MIAHTIKLTLFPLFLLLLSPVNSYAQFMDSFDDDKITGWEYFTGDGEASMDFIPKAGYATIKVDATKDQHNVWWAIIKRNVAESLDLSKLEHPDYELRVEAKVRLSDAPRRLNFMINTQRTTDFHKHLMEFDIADTTQWHIISMTTRDLDAVPGDDLNVQLGVTDWGYGKYEVDIDYYRADIINVKEAGPDKGEPLAYHPPAPAINTFDHHLQASQNAMINTNFPDVNFTKWKSKTENSPVLSVSGNQWAILRWDFEEAKTSETDGAGLLELTTYSVFEGGRYEEIFGEDLGMEFGKIRVIEILNGKPDWKQSSVSYNNLTGEKPYEAVFNEQMIFDTEVTTERGGKTYITLSRPVMQRLLSGTTKGLLLKPLGAIDASFYSSEAEQQGHRPKIHFSLKTEE